MKKENLAKQIKELLDKIHKEEKELIDLFPKTYRVIESGRYPGTYVDEEYFELYRKIRTKQIVLRSQFINEVLKLIGKFLKSSHKTPSVKKRRKVKGKNS